MADTDATAGGGLPVSSSSHPAVLLEQRELAQLLALLSEDAKPMEVVSASFSRAFAKSDHFRIGCSIALFLMDDLLTRSQRIVALFLLIDLFRRARAPCVAVHERVLSFFLSAPRPIPRN